jgi:hypothetical protein
MRARPASHIAALQVNRLQHVRERIVLAVRRRLWSIGKVFRILSHVFARTSF